MLPRETSVRQLKMLRKLTKGKDIGDLTVGDRLNHNIPNLQYIGNPVDTGIDSYEDFTEKDSQLQTIAFKSKLCNKPLVKENKQKNMKKLNNLITLNEYHCPSYEPLPGKVPEELEPYYLDKLHKRRYAEEPEYKDKWDTEKLRKKSAEEEINKINARRAIKKDLIDRFSDFDEEEDEVQPVQDKALEATKYEFLGKEEEPKSNPNFGYAAVRDQEIKKIGSFTEFTKVIDPPTPKERSILNAGVFIDNDIVKGYVNRIEGKDVYVESLEEPMVIKKFSLKDAVKIKKEK